MNLVAVPFSRLHEVVVRLKRFPKRHHFTQLPGAVVLELTDEELAISESMGLRAMRKKT